MDMVYDKDSVLVTAVVHMKEPVNNRNRNLKKTGSREDLIC